MIRELLESLRAKDRRIGDLEHRLDQLLRRLYGPRSEKINPSQLALFQELIEQVAQEDPEPEDAPAEASGRPKRKGHGRRPLPEHLARKRVVHGVTAAERICPCCGKEKTKIGEEISEQLEYQPPSLYVVEHVREKYACRDCEEGVTTADKPRQPIEKGLPGPGLLAQVIVSKYCDHIPLHRQEVIFRRHGVDLPRSTLCGWMGQAAALLTPLYDTAVGEVLCSRAIGTDDTPVDVQDPERKGLRKGRIWVYVGDENHPYIVYAYTANRSRDGPATFLGDYEGYLQADAFAGYDGIYAGEKIIEVLCWAHARRKFYDAQTSDPARSLTALAYIRELYAVEGEAKELFAAQGGREGAEPFSTLRLRLRGEKSLPILAKFEEWMRDQINGTGEGGIVLPKSPMGQAIDYCLSNWEALKRYTEDGDLSIDNNASERALRGIAVGRKNWLFAGSDNGGRTAAVLYTLVASAKRHGLDPFAYLRDVIARISDHPASQVAELLPDRWRPLPREQDPDAPAPSVTAAPQES